MLDYELPPELIAQTPSERREDARLLVVERDSGALHDSRVADLANWLRPGDCLALNETRVRPARLRLRRATGGAVECLFVRPEPDGGWRVLARPARNARVGERLVTDAGDLEVEVRALAGEGVRVLSVVSGNLDEALHAHGEIPLPPYIQRPPDPSDAVRYQTVFARVDGAVAAPTAGLHFSEALLEALAAGGVEAVRLLLHVGPGTFRPIAGSPDDHVMDEEWFDVGAGPATRLNEARASGGRIVAVGTTAVRALESACDACGGALGPAHGWTSKFIRGSYRFQAVDAMLTNFHLPRTTLLLLVAAFAGEGRVRAAYAHAVRERYRFYSYGDAMLLL